MTDENTLKHHIRTLAAAIPRPVGLHTAAMEVAHQLTPDEIADVVLATLTDWIMSDEIAVVPGHGTMLVGPAPDPDDPDAWE